MIEFAEPIWLVGGVVACAALAWLVVWAGRKRRVALEAFASSRLLGGLTAGVSEGRRRAKAWLLIGGVACLFVALARPQWGARWEEVTRRGIDVLLAVDTSRSMLAPDVAPNRLERAKLGIYDFVQKLEGDRVGLMPFAGQAFLLCPLTLDYGAFGESLQAVNTAIVPEGGTDIALAIRTAEEAFEKGANHKILVLITDGEDLEGEALEAARSAAENGVTIHTVGVGTPNGELIPLGGAGFVKDADGQAVKSRLDEAALGEIAGLTGGVYARLGDRGEGLERIYQEKLALVPEEELAQRMKEVKTERFQWPLALGVLLLVAEYLVRVGKRRGAVAGVPNAVATPVLVAGLAVVMLVGAEAGEDPRVVYNSGTEQYAAEEWDAAEASFRAALDTGDVGLQGRAYYNLGNTLYRKGVAALGGEGGKEATVAAWEAAVDAFDNTLALDPDDEDAAFNKAFVEKKLEELKQEEEQEDQEQQDDQENQENEENEEQENKNENEEKNQEEQEQDGGEGEQEKSEAEDERGEGEEPRDESGEGEESESEESGDRGGEEEMNKEAENEERNPGAEEGQGEDGQDEKDANRGEEKPADQQARPTPAGDRVPGEMSREEAVQLLRSMLNEEGEFQAIPYSLRGKRERSTGRVKRDW